MVLKRHLSPIGKKGSIVKHGGKGSQAQRLGLNQMQTLTPGEPISRSMNDYAKQTPMPGPPSGFDTGTLTGAGGG